MNEIKNPKYKHYSRLNTIKADEAQRLLASFDLCGKNISDPDEYNNLLKEEFMDQYKATKDLISFVEEKRIVKFIDSKMLKKNQMYYTFIDDEWLVISCLYAKIQMDGYDGVVSIIGLTRVDYKKNVSIMGKLLSTLN